MLRHKISFFSSVYWFVFLNKKRCNLDCKQNGPKDRLPPIKHQNIFSFPLALNIPFSHSTSPLLLLSSLALFSFSFHTLVPLLHCLPQFPRTVWVSLTKKTRSDNEKKALCGRTRIALNETEEEEQEEINKKKTKQKRLGEKSKTRERGKSNSIEPFARSAEEKEENQGGNRRTDRSVLYFHSAFCFLPL